jgi:uncharacterized protein YgbK (DUF1537 family)
VVVVNTESRHLDPQVTAARVGSVVSQARAAGIEHFYKKTDSTLRGNIGGELEALLNASGERALAFAPAYPKLGRTTRAGFQYVGGQLIHESSFACDALDPVTESFIPEIIRRQSQVETRIVTAADCERLQALPMEQTIFIFDGETDGDLRQVAEVLKRKGLTRALAGAAGFAEHLPKVLEFASVQVDAIRYPDRMMVVNGSLNPVSNAQVAYARDRGFARVQLPPEMLVGPEGLDPPTSERVISEVIALDAEGKDVILDSAAGGDEACECHSLGERLNLSGNRLHLRIAENIGRIVSRISRRASFKMMAVFGGDTLAGIARASEWKGLIPKEEILPGIPVLRAAGKGRHLILTKAGGFGQEDVLEQIKNRTRSASRFRSR